MSAADIEEWRKLLAIATRPSVKSQIESFISTLESSAKLETVVPKPAVQFISIKSFSWDQTGKFVTILIPFTEEVSDVVIDYEAQLVDIKITSGAKHYQLKLKLYSEVLASGITWKFKSGYVHVKLPKASEGTWSSLSPEPAKKQPPKPSSDDNPQAMIMDLMKNLYNEGDDNMKRTIGKAWTEAMEKRMDSNFNLS
ncbi:conserved hypothetical protein [Theileria equi strain WA]|uniref:Calcyclin-binding protein n=1 Tax=Theileria equi strain WA TaxID=1537102 RepID=L1LDI7_THEEQ|nr:conserved hypothetical protein [Theileria equi strain WA]EKX73329.1 conserved hypothetical protein [Theileria equi strain WA]|eukprot:XP_004832781.1 conserved hypothetical protein [Theileria equi strain WA]